MAEETPSPKIIEAGKDLTRAFFEQVDRMDDDAKKVHAVFSALGQILGSSYVKVVDDFGTAAGDEWLQGVFAIAQVFISSSGKNVQFSFLKKEGP